jgi:hypothetical protein
MLTAPNRIFLHYGSVLIALSSADGFEWNPQSGILAPASAPRAGDSEFRVRKLKTAVAIETALPSEFPGATADDQLAAYRAMILTKTRLEFEASDKPVGRYTDRAGHVLECVFDGTDKIDGTAVDYKLWPVLENPWMRQDAKGGQLTLHSGGKRIVYDFTKWQRLGPTPIDN